MLSVRAAFLVVLAVALLALAGMCGAEDVLTVTLDEPDVEVSSGVSKAPTPPAKPPVTASKPAAKVGRVAVVSLAKAGIYRSKSGTSARYYTVTSNTPLAIVREEGDWLGVLMSNGATGWISRVAVRMTEYDLVAEKPAVSRSSSVSRGGLSGRASGFGTSIVQTALGYSGSPYLYGGVDSVTGIDCSAFVRLVFSRYGNRLPRTAREQAQVGAAVPFDQLLPGDRLYFSCKNSYIDHCGIYAGGGYFVHSSASRGGVGVDSLISDFYWRSLIVARR